MTTPRAVSTPSLLRRIIATSLATLLVAAGLFWASPAPARAVDNVLGCRFSPSQVFDVQWGIGGTAPNRKLAVFGATYPYYSTDGGGQLSASDIDATDYYGFFPSTTNPGYYGLNLYRADGTVKRVMNDWGTWQASGSGFLFYLGADTFGTLFTTQSSLNIGGSDTFPVDQENLTNEQALAYTSCSDVPIPPPGTRQVTITQVEANPTTVSTIGQNITYTYTVTNSGSVEFTSLSLTDTVAGTATCGGGALAVGTTKTCTATYTVTQDDLDAGSIVNSATAVGTASDSQTATSPSAGTTVTVNANPSLSLSVNPVAPIKGGTTGPVSFKVTNTGNQTLRNIAVESPMDGLSNISCPSGDVAPGASITCTATYTAAATTTERSVTGDVAAAGTSSQDEIVADRATITITVTPGGPTASPSSSASASDDASQSSDEVLADSGAPGGLFGIGLVLVLLGGLATARHRRRCPRA